MTAINKRQVNCLNSINVSYALSCSKTMATFGRLNYTLAFLAFPYAYVGQNTFKRKINESSKQLSYLEQLSVNDVAVRRA